MDVIEQLLACWEEPVDEKADPAADFRAVYHDPVTVNGTAMPIVDLVARARVLQEALAGRRTEIVHRVEQGDVIVIAFLLRGRHVGPFPSPLGPVPASGRDVVARVTDVLTFVDGRVSDIWVISDDLGVLTQMATLTLGPAPLGPAPLGPAPLGPAPQ